MRRRRRAASECMQARAQHGAQRGACLGAEAGQAAGPALQQRGVALQALVQLAAGRGSIENVSLGARWLSTAQRRLQRDEQGAAGALSN